MSFPRRRETICELDMVLILWMDSRLARERQVMEQSLEEKICISREAYKKINLITYSVSPK